MWDLPTRNCERQKQSDVTSEIMPCPWSHQALSLYLGCSIMWNCGFSSFERSHFKWNSWLYFEETQGGCFQVAPIQHNLINDLLLGVERKHSINILWRVETAERVTSYQGSQSWELTIGIRPRKGYTSHTWIPNSDGHLTHGGTTAQQSIIWHLIYVSGPTSGELPDSHPSTLLLTQCAQLPVYALFCPPGCELYFSSSQTLVQPFASQMDSTNSFWTTDTDSHSSNCLPVPAWFILLI